MAGSGTLTFDPGETSQTVTVAVVGETLDEPDETFFVNLSSPVNAEIVDGQGVGTIVNDEPLPPPGADHDVGVAGGGLHTKGHIDESRISLGPFDVKIKVKNFGAASEDIFSGFRELRETRQVVVAVEDAGFQVRHGHARSLPRLGVTRKHACRHPLLAVSTPCYRSADNGNPLAGVGHESVGRTDRKPGCGEP